MRCSACNEYQEEMVGKMCIDCEDALEYSPDYDLLDQDEVWEDIVTHLDEANMYEFEDNRFDFDDVPAFYNEI